MLALTTGTRSSTSAYLSKDSGSVGFGIRVPVGLEWRPGDPSIGVFIYLAPGIAVVPATTAFVHAGLGIRYYF